jgi:GTP-binding protein Era
MNTQHHIPNGFKSGFAAIIGAPNAGKSTFLNKVLMEKISITSKKPQTTRNRILGVLNRPLSQIVFIDTPGIHDASSILNKRIVETAISAISDVDIILFMTDVAFADLISEKVILKQLEKQKKPVVLVLNKIDLVKKNDLLVHMGEWESMELFHSMVPICAKTGDNIDRLVDVLESLIPQGPPMFALDDLTDMSERFIVSEMIREKVFRLTGMEIPYSTAVTVESFSKGKEKQAVIHATIHVERDSQKGIIIGKNGSKLKQIGQDARKEIERLLGVKVFLKLFVRVQKNWGNDTKALEKFGY